MRPDTEPMKLAGIGGIVTLGGLFLLTGFTLEWVFETHGNFAGSLTITLIGVVLTIIGAWVDGKL